VPKVRSAAFSSEGEEYGCEAFTRGRLKSVLKSVASQVVGSFVVVERGQIALNNLDYCFLKRKKDRWNSELPYPT